jgi:hypothetical protein
MGDAQQLMVVVIAKKDTTMTTTTTEMEMKTMVKRVAAAAPANK